MGLHCPDTRRSIRRIGDPLVTQEGGDVNAIGNFKGQQAPCGRIVDGEHYEDRDSEVIVTQETIYNCGCRTIRHEYHDGTVSRNVIRHDGHVMVDELFSAE